MASFLFKTEPSEYSYDDLLRDKLVVWEGVSNALALIHLRTIRRGDTVVIFHTGRERAAVGLARALTDPYPDPRIGDPRRVVVDLEPVRRFENPVPISMFRTHPTLSRLELLRLPRLSVMPIGAAPLKRLIALSRRPPRP